jgi:hypothetical protein
VGEVGAGGGRSAGDGRGGSKVEHGMRLGWRLEMTTGTCVNDKGGMRWRQRKGKIRKKKKNRRKKHKRKRKIGRKKKYKRKEKGIIDISSFYSLYTQPGEPVLPNIFL